MGERREVADEGGHGAAEGVFVQPQAAQSGETSHGVRDSVGEKVPRERQVCELGEEAQFLGEGAGEAVRVQSQPRQV